MPQLLSASEIKARLKKASGWRIAGGRTRRIQKRYELGDFVKAIRFVNRVGRISEEAAHHPDIDIRYDRVTLGLSTHRRRWYQRPGFRGGGQVRRGGSRDTDAVTDVRMVALEQKPPSAPVDTASDSW